MSDRTITLILLLCLPVVLVGGVKMVRYPVGQPVPSSVYTDPFDPCDPAYKYMQTNYGEPNTPRWQAAPDDWVQRFGDNERTMLLHAVSELRVVAAAQSKRILALEAWQKEQPLWQIDPNGVNLQNWWERYSSVTIPCVTDPNEGKP